MRYLASHIEHDLGEKMVFVGGPRQCGKTTMARELLNSFAGPGRYMSWDDEGDRAQILARSFGAPGERIVLDELHKFPRWKNWLKGIYDKSEAGQQYLITGSARLDVYRRGGDSLMGRYHFWRLHPFCLDDHVVGPDKPEVLRRLMEVGGFPEPFVKNDPRGARRWRRSRMARLLRDDVRDLEGVAKLATLELFVHALRERVGTPIVLTNLAADLQVSATTLKQWLEVLERLYICFVVRPFSHSLPRAVSKPPKVYFFDNLDVLGDAGARFENLVATHLLKRVNLWEDRDGYGYTLHHLRDKEKREVHFVVARDGRAVALIEAKLSDTSVSAALRYYRSRLEPSLTAQVVGRAEHGYLRDGILVTPPAALFCGPLRLAEPAPLGAPG